MPQKAFCSSVVMTFYDQNIKIISFSPTGLHVEGGKKTISSTTWSKEYVTRTFQNSNSTEFGRCWKDINESSLLLQALCQGFYSYIRAF